MSLFGPRWPLKRGNQDTYELILSKKQQINFELKCLLLTSPGENISDPKYGVGLRQYLFEMNNFITQEDMVSRIREQASRYLPEIELLEVTMATTDQDIDENSLIVKIIYRIDEDLEEFDMNINSNKEIGFY
tara:strand:+ start:8582 stop:8977 length:396 start_codon:yes stop_codon:yes gene_type:complete